MSSTPQFGTAEYKSASGPDRCQSCQQELSGAYFRINGLLACEKCTRQLQAQTPKDTHAAYVRGILFGVGGAIVGLILYSGFGIATGIRLGYIALAVGWLVGTAIKKGSSGIGGRRYQIAAVALTYAAVSLSAIPVGIYYIVKEKNAAQISHPPNSSPAFNTTEPGSASPQDDPPASGRKSTPSLTSAAGALLFALVAAITQLLADLLQAWLQPRLRSAAA